jgi:cell division protein FtsB
MLTSRIEGNTAYADYSAYCDQAYRTPKKKTSTRNTNPMLKAGIIAAVIVGMILLYLFQLSLVTGAGYSMLEAQNALSAVKNKNKALSVEVARLKSLDRIEDVARNELQMVTPKGASVLAVKTKTETIENTLVSYAGEECVVPVTENIVLKESAREILVKALSRVTASWVGEVLSYLI